MTQTQNETGNKQHILAEDSLGNHLIPSLNNLFIAEYGDCTVLAVFSCLEKKLLAYKITLPAENLKVKEPWLTEDFNSVTTLSFSHEFEITPLLFSNETFNGQNIIDRFLVAYKTDNPEGSIHYISALIGYHLIKKKHHQIYLFSQSDCYSFILMDGDQCLLANSFICDSENEVLYFLLNTLNISDILPSDTTLLIDYSLAKNTSLLAFLSPHIASTEFLEFSFEGMDQAIPQLPEKLFACYAASLCG